MTGVQTRHAIVLTPGIFRGANTKEMKRVRDKPLFGIELDDDMFTLAVANMIVRGNGKSMQFSQQLPLIRFTVAFTINFYLVINFRIMHGK